MTRKKKSDPIVPAPEQKSRAGRKPSDLQGELLPGTQKPHAGRKQASSPELQAEFLPGAQKPRAGRKPASPQKLQSELPPGTQKPRAGRKQASPQDLQSELPPGTQKPRAGRKPASPQELQSELPPGVPAVRDFITGRRVRATPEEVDAVQVIARRLVEDYGYPKAHIQTHPQHRVRRRPSGGDDSYPIDVGVFSSKSRADEDLFIVVECKKKNLKDGLEQLRIYMDMSAAEVGVWFNGDEHVYIRKVYRKGGRATYERTPNIPRYGQRIEDVGKYLRKDLRKPQNLKVVFRDLRNHLAGNAVGIARDEALAQQIINVLFCKIYDEINTAPDDIVDFRAGIDEPATDVRDRLVGLFHKVKSEYADVFAPSDTITLDPESILYTVGELQPYCITQADRDAVGDAFEVFIGPALRGSEGQFFTPRNVVQMVMDLIDPESGDMIIDPACGSGGFLITALEHVWRKIEAEGRRKGWTKEQLVKRQAIIASRCFRGFDKDSFLAKVTKAYMAIMGDGRGGVFCENSLARPADWSPLAQEKIQLGTFDVVVTNPPFGKNIKIQGSALLKQYDLGHKWSGKKTGEYEITNSLHTFQPPQIIFLERCVQLLKTGGRLGVVIPESILGNPSYEHLVHWMLTHTTLKAVVTLPDPLFKTSGKGGTHTKVCVIVLEKQRALRPYDIFMADVKWCGHDSRGNPTIRQNDDGTTSLLDEVPDVAQRFRQRDRLPPDRLGFLIRSDQLLNNVLVPKYYDPGIKAHLERLRETHELVSIGELVADGVISVATGTEVGKMAYGTGPIPFVRTSDISNWEIKSDFKHGVSRYIYEQHVKKANVQAGDILMVRDGTYLIGTTAIVTESDVPMLYQSHLFRLRVKRPAVLDPWLLLALLNTPIVRRQVRAKQFTQDIIDTLGRRLAEIVLPVPKDEDLGIAMAKEVRALVETRIRLRNRAKEIPLMLEGHDAEEELEELEHEDLEQIE